ncbi:hypothetical protein EON77_21540, partial [bacterium]
MFNRSTPPRDPVLDGLLRDAGLNVRGSVALLRELLLECPDGNERLAAELQIHEVAGDLVDLQLGCEAL